MDIGIIASRYAKALYKYAEEQGATKHVYQDFMHLTALFETLPKFKTYLASPELSYSHKIELLCTALEVENTSSSVTLSGLALVLRNQRASFLSYICHSYLLLYRKLHNIRASRLTTVHPIGATQVARFKEIVGQHTEGEVELHVVTDEDLLGGFTLEFDGYRIDASLRNQLQKIKRKLGSATA